MVYLTKVFEFSAAHRYHNPDFSDEKNLELFGACNNPAGHGHNYGLEVTVAGEPDPATGFFMNATDLKRIVQERIVDVVDHRFLNKDVPHFATVIPSSEEIVRWMWDQIADSFDPYDARLHRIKLVETSTIYVEYFGPGDAG
jgi:6-pyruvoyltetrahydropterin/6-carboxytetrahydropterin synthase